MLPLESSNTVHYSDRNDTNKGVKGAIREALGGGISAVDAGSDYPQTRIWTLGVHDEAFSKADVLINGPLFPLGHLATGAKLKITSANVNSPRHLFRSHSSGQREGIFGRRMSCKNYRSFP